MKRILAVAVIAAALLPTGCQKQPVAPLDREISGIPGKFAVSWMKGLSKSSALRKAAGDGSGFDLGSLKGSGNFYFLVYNIGETPIIDAKLSVSDSSFLVNPSKIDSLLPGGEIGMLPVVKVTALHGSPIDGPGYRSVMKPGPHACTLAIAGTTKTIQGKDTSVSLEVALEVFALVMDMEVIGDSGRVIDLTEPTSLTVMKIDGYIIRDLYGYDSRNGIISFRNIGNVPIIVRDYVRNINSEGILKSTSTILPGDSLTVTMTMIPGENIDLDHFSLDGRNVVLADPRKFKMENNGLCYLHFFLNTIN